MPLKPKPFEMSNPYRSGDEYHISLYIDPKHWDFVQNLATVNDVVRLNGNLIHVHFNPQYNIEDAWLDLYEQLTIETSGIELDSRWDIELDDVPPETK